MKPPISGDDVVALIAHAVSGDTTSVAEVLASIAERGGTRGLYAASCALAEATIRLCNLLPDPDGFVGLQVHGNACRDRIWAGQFIAAHANRDHDQTWALFLATQNMAADPLNPVELVDRISNLILIAAAAVRASRRGPA